MRIRLLLVMILIFATIDNGYAQYDSLVKPGKKWYYKKFDGERWNPGGKDLITNDTVIFKGKKYNYANINSCYFTSDTILLREENKRVYIVGLGNSVFHGKERILYDFNLEKGDSFKFYVPAGRTPTEFKDSIIQIILVVDTVYKKNERKQISFNPIVKSNQLIPPQVWIEGIGNSEGWLCYNFHRLSLELSEQTCALIQMCDNNLRILPNPGICNDSIAVINSIKKNELKIFPNPAQNNFSFNLLSTEKHYIIISNSIGQIIDKRELEGSYEYNISFNYPKGIYFINAYIKNISSKSILVVK